MTAAGMTAGLLDRRVGSRTVLFGGALMTGLGYAFVALQHAAMWQLYVGGLARGIGLGFAYAAVANLVVAAVLPPALLVPRRRARERGTGPGAVPDPVTVVR